MSSIKSYFTIKELENISAISAHTIRIWERRYQLFQPYRTANNKRYYNLDDLKYLLNIDLLRKDGLKISKIANHSKEEVFVLANNIVNRTFKNEYALMELKMSMYGYDTDLFNKLYKKAIRKNSFKIVFKDIFLPFLHYIGLFWQTKTITIAHEHFISNLIYQKIQLNIAQLKPVPNPPSDRTFVLYLQEEEMHEIGLLYLNYELKSLGYRTVYLGRNVPLEDLESLKLIYPTICWVSNFTLVSKHQIIKTYFDKVKTLLIGANHEYWAIGQNLPTIYDLPKRLIIYKSIEEVLKKI